MFSFSQLAYFCTAYRHRSLKRAADELFLSRQALSRSLVTLEKELGGQLFIRQSGGIQPTALADAFYPEARALLEKGEHLKSKMQRLARDNKVSLRIGATFSAIETTFPLLPIEFGKRHPSIDLAIEEHPDAELEQLVLDGTFEGAFVLGPAAPIAAEIVATPIHRERLGMLMQATHPLASKRELELADLANEPLLLANDKYKVRAQLLDRLTDAGVQPHIAYSSGDFSLLVKMCQLGEGIAPLPCSRASIYESLGLVTIPFAAACDPGWQIDFIRCSGADDPSFALSLFEEYLLQRSSDTQEDPRTQGSQASGTGIPSST